MRIYLNREEQEKAIMLYLEKEGFGTLNKTITCKFARDTVEVDIEENIDTKPTIDLNEPIEIKPTDIFED